MASITMQQTLDTDVEADCAVESSEIDLDLPSGCGTPAMMGIVPRQPKPDPTPMPQVYGVVTRDTSHRPLGLLSWSNQLKQMPATCPGTSQEPAGHRFLTTRNISDDMIEDGSHVVFDWDNTLKLYDKTTHQLSCRVSKQFLMDLKHRRHCRLYIMSAIRPSALNLGTILSEVEKLGLTDVFVGDSCDMVDGESAAGEAVIKTEYAHMGNVIICGYDKAETFLKLAMYDSSKGDKVMFFDDEIVNIHNFSALVPDSKCYLCE